MSAAAATAASSKSAVHGKDPLKKLNLVFLGEKHCGKTALVNRFLHDTENDTLYKVEVDASKKKITLTNRGLQLRLIDTSGLERHRSTVSSYIHHSTIFIVVYDITDPNSFRLTSEWVDVIRSEHGEDSIIAIVGNKMELGPNRQVTTEEGEQKAKELKTMFIETSAVAGPNVTILFRRVIAAILNPGSSKSSDTGHDHNHDSSDDSSCAIA